MKYIHYPKLLALTISFIAAYLLFQEGFFNAIPSVVEGHGYVSMFLGGALIAFGFTAPFGAALFVELAHTVNPYVGAIAGSLGAVTVDVTIFSFVRFSFDDELHQLKASAVMQWVRNWLYHESIPERIQQYMAWSVAGMLIASPLPDEVGVAMLSGFTELKGRPFSALCFGLHTTGILMILLATRVITT